MKRPNITPEDWQFNGSTVFALTPYRGDSPKVAKLCPDGINRFSCRVSADNSEQSGGASQAEIDANAQFIAAALDMAKALEGLLTSPLFLDLAANNGSVFTHWAAAKAALSKAGYEFP
jgi:hypothetical protein